MQTQPTPSLRSRIENTIRGLVVDAVQAAGIGHLGAPLGLARPVFQLWDQHLRFDPQDPAWLLRDRFVLSAGHASMLLYALLHLFETGLELEEIANFRQLGSRTPGHPEFGVTPGVEVTTGPLGQGIGNAVGMALAARVTRSRFEGAAAGPGNHFVYVVASDGDLMEGVGYEACSLAGHLGLGNLIVLYDDNRVTIDGPTSLSFSEDVAGRFGAQGFQVESIDAEDVAALDGALETARAARDQPSLLILRSTIGRGSGWAGQSRAHGGPFDDEEALRTRRRLGLPEGERFVVEDEVRAYLRARARAKHAERLSREADFEGWRKAKPAAAILFDRARAGALPDDFIPQLVRGFEGQADATRKHSGAVIQRLVEMAPGRWIGGSADLAGSNNTTIRDGGFIGEGDDPFAGANIHFGVREHAMGAITNGIALDGTLLPFAGTFMVFSDYLRPALRLAALMQIPSTFVFTHDSIFVGEDGPTHQPVEQLDALRAIPGLTVFRPADGVEAAMAWAFAAQRERGPVAIVLSRQKVAALKREADFRPGDVWKGGYLLREPVGPPAVALLATGSELPLACDAAVLLAEQSIAARVVSLPCLSLLLAQDAAYIEELLPRDLPAVAVEAGLGESLRVLVGRDGLIYGQKSFGASAPWTTLAEHFGFTPEKLAQAVRDKLGR